MSLEFVQYKEKEFKCMHVILAEQFYHWKTQVTSVNITEQPVKVRSSRKKKKKKRTPVMLSTYSKTESAYSKPADLVV